MVDNCVQQGDIIRIEGIKTDALVLSREFFNLSGMSVVCPIFHKLQEDALHIPVKTEGYCGIAAIEQMKSLDMKKRFYSRIGHLGIPQIQNISDAVQGIFEYYPFGNPVD